MGLIKTALKVILVLFVAVVLLGALIGSDNDKVTKVDDTSVKTTPTQQPVAKETATETQATTTPETTNAAAPTTYKVGEIVTDGKTNIVVNNVRISARIDEKNNEFLVAEAQSGYEYVILDVTIENVGSDTMSYSPMINFKVYDSSGYSYNDDFTAETALSKPFDGNNVVPGSKRRGEVPFMVPTDAQGLQLQFSFGAFGSNVAIINLE